MKTLICSLLLALPVSAVESLSGWSLQPGPAWQVSGTLKGKKDLSALDLISGSAGLLASDEGSQVHAVRLEPAARRLTIGQGYPLLAPGEEADIEGIAAAPAENCYYVTGSHAVSRKKQEIEASRYHLFRIRLDPATRLPSGVDGAVSLRPALESFPELKAALDRPAGANGMDIEGLAWKDGRLFVGFRAPFQGENTWVLETSTKTLFEGGAPDAKLHALPVGRATGIRALTPIREGFLFLSGDSGQDLSTVPPALYVWQPGSPPVRLGKVPAPGKPEALAVLSETASTIELLMLSDGPVHGSPVGLQVEKRPLP